MKIILKKKKNLVSICNNAPEYRHQIHAHESVSEKKREKKALQMRIYYFSVLYSCASLSVLNICALTSDLFMAQFRHGFASRFHTRSAPIRPLNRVATKKQPTTETERQREEKLNWIPSIFTDTSCAHTHTHQSCNPKRVKYATNGTFHQANVDSYRFSMWAPFFLLLLFLSLLFSFCSVWSLEFLRLNESPYLFFRTRTLSVCKFTHVVSLFFLSSKWARAVRNLFIIYYQTFNNTYSRNNTFHVDRRGRKQ